MIDLQEHTSSNSCPTLKSRETTDKENVFVVNKIESIIVNVTKAQLFQAFMQVFLGFLLDDI